jgi:hypothetical protein
MPGEEFIRQGDIGRELGFVAGGVLDLLTEDAGSSVHRSVHGDNLDMPTVVGEISFFLSTTQPFRVRKQHATHSADCLCAFYLVVSSATLL